MTTTKPLTKSGSRPRKAVPKGLVVGLSALAITLLCVALSQQLELVELEAVRQILPALKDLGIAAEISLDSDWASKIFQLLSLYAATLVAIIIGKRLKGPGLIIVTLQIYLLNAVFQTGLLAVLQLPPLFVSSFLSIVLAAASGSMLKQFQDDRKVIETQYYEQLIRNRELAEARLALVKQDEVERRLLAADLHDQVLNDLKKILEAFLQFEKEPADTKTGSSIRSGFQKTMNDIREIMDDLCPVMLQNFGLRVAVEDCLDKGKERSGYDGDFECHVDDEELEHLSAVEQSLLFRLIQESLTNISKHAQASLVSITIAKKDSTLLISIEDNGKGIDYASVSHQSRGLRYMKLRADLIDATVDWKQGKNGKGTIVVISFPLKPDSGQNN